MKTSGSMVPKISYALLAAFLLAMAVRSQNDTTLALVACALLVFAFCWANATHLLGAKPAFKFVLIAVSLGWPLGDVPMIIPLMWFALCYVGYVISNLIVWQNPVHVASSKRVALFMSFLAAAIVTAHELALAEPAKIGV